MDIAHDRAGFYLCWGCLVWVPSLYTAPVMFLAQRPGWLPSWGAAAAVFAAGALAIWVNYDCDRQRAEFRRSKGKALVWGAPPRKIVASYRTADGGRKSSLLLLSGWWGLARHFHYAPEIAAAFFWSLPGGNFLFPYMYVIFLAGLLADRAFRDDARCAAKYGKYWDAYRAAVPARVVPYVF